MNTKLICIASAIILFSASCKKSSSSDINLNNGLLAYYPFNGDANDAGPNKLNGAIQGNVTFTSDVSGKANSAALFDGVSSFINVPDNTGILSPSEISISLLVNFIDISSRAALVDKIEYDNATGLCYSIGIPYANDNQFGFAAIPNSYGCSNSSYNSSATMYNSLPLVTNKWYHVVAIFAGSMQKIYINSVLTTAVTRNFSSLNQCSNATSFLIGGWWKNDIISLHGSLDEIRIYNRALNQDEINQLAKPVK